MPSPQQIIDGALRGIGAIGSGESAAGSEDTEFSLVHYNQIVGDLQAKQLGWFDVNEAFTFSASQQSYSIGPAGSGANFIMTAGGVRPPAFHRAKLVRVAPSPDQEVELPILTVQTYSALPQPAQSAAEPIRIYYQPTFPTGTLWPVPYPTTTANQLRLFWRNQLAAIAIADITTSINMPSGVEGALMWELMRRLAAGGFGKPLTEEQRLIAADSWGVLITMKNADPVLVNTDIRGADEGRYSTFNPNTLARY